MPTVQGYGGWKKGAPAANSSSLTEDKRKQAEYTDYLNTQSNINTGPLPTTPYGPVAVWRGPVPFGSTALTLGYAGGGPSRKSFSLRNIFSAGNNGLDLAGFSIPPTPFTPLSISGAILWLDAADTSTITSNVATGITGWADKSGYGYNAAPGLFTIPGCVVWVDAALQGIEGAVTTQLFNFGTAGGYFTTTTASGTVTSTAIAQTRYRLDLSAGANITVPSVTYTQTTRTVFAVVTVGSSSGTKQFFTGGVTPDTQFYSLGSSLELNAFGVQLQVAPSPQNFLNTTSLICGTSTTADRGIYVNGSGQTTSINSTAGFPTGTSTSQVIGNAASAAFSIYELLVFDGALTTSQRQQMEGYLAWKYNLQSLLPLSHPYYTTPFRTVFTASYTPPLITSRTLNKLNAVATNKQILTIPTFGWTTWSTVFAVVYTPTNFSYFAGSSNYTNYIATFNYYLYVPGPGVGSVYDNVIAPDPGTQVLPLNQWNIFSIGYGGGTQATNYAINGTPRSTTSTNSAANQTTLTSLYINAWAPGNVYGGDDNIIAEILHFNRSLTNNERQTIEGYLAWKWGLVGLLPPDHPKRNNPVR